MSGRRRMRHRNADERRREGVAEGDAPPAHLTTGSERADDPLAHPYGSPDAGSRLEWPTIAHHDPFSPPNPPISPRVPSTSVRAGSPASTHGLERVRRRSSFQGSPSPAVQVVNLGERERLPS